MNISVSEKLFERFPALEEHIVIATGLNNEISGKAIVDRIRKAEEQLREKGTSVLDEPRYKRWVEAYQNVAKDAGLNPNAYDPSHISLARRVLSGKELPNINPVVNLYNLYSIEYGIPIGGENLDEVFGDLSLYIAEGGEKFLELGSSKVELLSPGEVTWGDDHSVTCRMWAWRECERTKMTPSTKNICFVFDSFADSDDVDMASCVKKIAAELEKSFGAEVTTAVLNKNTPEASFDFETKQIPLPFWDERVVIGKLQEVSPHPNSGKLVVLKVDTGEDAPATIVCGNTELKTGQVVTVFKPGATRIDQNGEKEEVTQTSVKGIESQGILGTPKELGIGTSYYDEWILPKSAEKYIGKALLDVVTEFEMPVNPPRKKKRPKKSKELMKRKPSSLDLSDSGHLAARLSADMDECLGGDGMQTEESSESAGPTESTDVVLSPDNPFGDLSSTIPMRMAGKLRKNPKEIAEDYVSILKSCDRIDGVYDEISVDGKGFINAKLSNQALVSELETALSENEEYGRSQVGDSRVILIESPSINPNAAAHAGHLLNLFIGRSLMRLFSKVGFKTYADNLINDRGIKICMAMWGVENLTGDTPDPETAGMKPDQFVGTYYVKAKERYSSDSEVKKQIDQMLRDWEAGEKKVLKLWEKVVGWAYKGHLKTFERLGEEPGHMWYESELYEKGRDIIMAHLGKGVIEKLPDGAVVGRLEEKYGIPDVILLRSDGTSLYHTQDIYLTLQKIEKFDPWLAVWVVGNEQIAHFQQLFALLDEMGILSYDRLYHYAYGMVVDKDGSKLGKNATDATADALIGQVKEKAAQVIENRHIDVEVEDEDAVAESVGIAALRYAFLSRDPFKNVVYDPDSAVSFTGRSGPYIMYTYARAKSVLRKALGEKAEDYGSKKKLGVKPPNVKISQIEREVLLRLLMYPEIVLSAANNYAPNMIADYLYDTASAFNNFYEKLTISGANGDQKEFRLGLTKLLTIVLADGMRILGMDVPEKM